MPTLSLNIIPSRKNEDGTHTIRVVLSHKHRTVYISTPYKVWSTKEWKNGMVVGVPDANIINRKLRNLINSYQDRLDELPVSRMSCAQVRDVITEKSIMKLNIKQHIEQLQKNYAMEGKMQSCKSFQRMMHYLFNVIPDDAPYEILNKHIVEHYEKYMYKKGLNNTTAYIYLSFLRTAINAAINEGLVKYDVHPFAGFKMPKSNVRDICLTKEEFTLLRNFTPRTNLQQFSKDIFLLSFYLGGINYADLCVADTKGDTLTFIRSKTARRKNGDNETSITIQPEAKEILKRYENVLPRLFKKHPTTALITHCLNTIGENIGLKKTLMYYSARKTFVQFGFELDIPLYILEYAIGHTIKEASYRPIFNYITIMRKKADDAIRRIIDYANKE